MKNLILSTVLAMAALLPLGATAADVAAPKAELRAVWLTTNGNLDWPSSRTDAGKQQAELVEILDRLQAANFNTILFQAQVKGDVAWKSTFQPAMYSFTGNGSKELPYDVARFVIDECHKRDMECHAWIVPFRIGTANEAARYRDNQRQHPIYTHPEWCRLYQGGYFLDPGLPEVREYLMELYREMLAEYDFDGVSFDYTRYPAQDGFPDEETYADYNPQSLNLKEWRTENINTFMADFYEMAKTVRPDVKVGSSPIGTYKNLPGYGNMTASGVYQDPVQWMNSGNHDLIIPMIYFNEKYGFSDFMADWGQRIEQGGMATGLAAYKVNDGTNDWEVSTLLDQIDKVRANADMTGVSFFRTEHVISTSHPKYEELYDALANNYFRYPAHIPAIESMGITQPAAPSGVKQEYTGGAYIVTWDEPDEYDEVRYHTVYLCNGRSVDLNDPQSVAAHKVHGTSFSYHSDDPGLRFAVTAFDRRYFESSPTIADASGVENVNAESSAIQYCDYTLRVTGTRRIDRVDIFSITGLPVRSVKTSDSSVAVELGALSRGTYLARVTYADGGSTIEKILR